ncbi:MAG: NifU family protein [Anaeroplasmataceae bacterium]
MNDLDKIKEVLDKIRPYINNDGGDLQFIKFVDGIVYIKMMGACMDCHMLDSTLYDGIEAMLIENVPSVIGLKNVVEEI